MAHLQCGDSVRNIKNAHVVRDEENDGSLFGCKLLKFGNDRITPPPAFPRKGRNVGAKINLYMLR